MSFPGDGENFAGGGGGEGYRPPPMNDDDAAFMFFSNQQRQRQRPWYRNGPQQQPPPPPMAPNFDQKAADPYVSIDKVVREIETGNVKTNLKRRFRQLAASIALSNGDSEAAAAVIKKNDEDSDDDAQIDGIMENSAVAPSAIVASEIAAANISTRTMCLSSCSEDEMVLCNALQLYSLSDSPFEEDSAPPPPPPPPKRHKSPVSEDFPFADPHNEVPMSGFGDLPRPAPAAAASTSSDEAPADSSAEAQIREVRKSQRARINQLRVQVHNEWLARGSPAPECFKCMWGNSTYDSVNAPLLHELFRLMDCEIGHRDLRAVARVAHQFFKEAIFIPMVTSGKRMFMWRTRDIYECLKRHNKEPRIVIYRTLDSVDSIDEILLNKMLTVNPQTKQTSPSILNIRTWIELQKLRWQLYALDPKKLVFYDDRASIDFNPSATFFTASAATNTTLPSGHFELGDVGSVNTVRVRNK